jgi:hypothetical protein
VNFTFAHARTVGVDEDALVQAVARWVSADATARTAAAAADSDGVECVVRTRQLCRFGAHLALFCNARGVPRVVGAEESESNATARACRTLLLAYLAQLTATHAHATHASTLATVRLVAQYASYLAE